MSRSLGMLSFESVSVHGDLVAPVVRAALMEDPEHARDIEVAPIDAALSDTAAFCDAYQIGLDQTANCVILEAARAGETWYAACVVRGSDRADINGIIRRALGARSVSFASMAYAVETTSMAYGAITPLGLPHEWRILVDAVVAETPHIVIGSGIRGSKILIPGQALAQWPRVEVLPLAR